MGKTDEVDHIPIVDSECAALKPISETVFPTELAKKEKLLAVAKAIPRPPEIQ